MFLRVHTLIAVHFMVILFVARLPCSRALACSYKCQQRYYTSCWDITGFFSCTRHREIDCYRCCDGWTGTVSGTTGCDTPICHGHVNYCPNGGTCSTPDNCINCNPGYYSPRCDECTRISFCDSVTCTTSHNQICQSCNGDYGTSFGAAYKPSSDRTQCIKQCSWRSDSNACFPGSCTDYAQCTCCSGFSGPDCRTLGSSQAPVLSEHRATLIMGTTTLESPRDQGSTATVYTNVRDFERIRINWESSYMVNNLFTASCSTNHAYVHSYRLGIVSARATAVVNRAQGGTHTVGSQSYSGAGSQLSPRTDLVISELEFSINYASWTPATGDVLRYDVYSSNGGFLKLHNRDNAGTFYTRYYSGRTTSGYSTFTFDFVDPYHCVDVSSGCRSTMLNAGDDVTSQATTSISWQGWADDLAGIKEYELQVRQLSGTHGSEMTEIFDSSAVYQGVTTSGHSVTFPHVGVYSIILDVVDNAGNVKRSRRFVFFDDDPDDVTTRSDAPLRVVSATPETSYKWLTSLDSSGGTTSVRLDWTNHFTNVRHHSEGLLKGIGYYLSDHGSIESSYDQNFGQRGRESIPNALGVTQFRAFRDIDHSGGRTTVTVSDDDSDNWSNEGTSTQATYDLSLVDGDSVRFWVEARDLAGDFVRDSVLVHADSSPPIIEDLWLVRDGEVNLAVHNSADLHEMSVTFRTYDIHSGVRTIEWRLFDNYTGTEMEHGHQTVPARKINADTEDCDPVSCMCIPIGDVIGDCYAVDYGFNPTFHIGVHDYDYFITLTVTNEARLVTTQTIKVTVDTSAPQAGVVHDGIRGSNEVDFQEGSILSAHWEGFFDRESGVKFYQYLFDSSCWNDTTMIGTVKDRMTRTTSTHASWTAPSPGLYYVTVIAYNRALEPSEPVCSDGVVIDTSPPELSQIALGYARMWPGLAKDAEGRVWFIDEHRRKTEVLNASSGCSSRAVFLDDLSVYPEMAGTNDSTSVLQGDLDCLWIWATEQKFFLPTHKHVTISWTGEDAESSIYDYEIGLSSQPSNPVPDQPSDPTPDLVTFTSTSGHDHFVMYHPHISHGSVFYLVLKATNKAQLASFKVIGPIVVDTTPPMFVGNVFVRVDDEYLIAEWGADGFIDDEDTSLRYQVAIGSSPGGTETLPYQLERDYKIGPCLSRTLCAAFLLDGLDWHIQGDHEYYVSIRAQNGAGLSTVGTSSVYRHIVQLPSLGVVLDVAPPQEAVVVNLGVAKDIDVQMDTTSISARWFGFEHPHLEVSYDIAVGSERGSSDVSGSFISVGNATFYQLDGLDLTPLTSYYVTVLANSEVGNVSVTSDGVKVIPKGQILEGAVVKDGLGCDEQSGPLPSGLSHHSSAADSPCQDDISYQASTSDISARWTIPEMLQPFVTNVLLTIEQEVEVYYGEGNTTMAWIPLLDDQDLGMTFQHVASSMGLHAGAHYRSKIQFCHTVVCFQPIVTDGFWVLSQPPEVGQVTVSNIVTTQSKTEIQVGFQPFAHDYVRPDDPQELMDFYEWSIAEDGSDGALPSQWTRIEDLLVTRETALFTASSSGSLDLDVCLRLSVRGYNKAGLSSIASAEIVDCDDVTLIVPHLVIDADHEVKVEQNALWPEPDKNYISSTSLLSAVWPTLRHRAYVWAAIEDTGSTDFGNLDNGLQYPCDHPRAKACGKTDKEFVNVPNLSLEHGMRYRICIHADEVTLEHELWKEELPAVSSCSDGVVVDTTPPTPGPVWIGWSQHRTYQSSSSELVLRWESFTDIEEHGLARHHSGIKYYEYAVGSMQGGSDVKEFTRVGISNSAILHNLRLQSGHMYYATIRATDFVGLSSQATSEPVFIDTSPPVVSALHTLDIGGSFIRSTTSVSASWENIFADEESGIAYYEWAVGSHPGHADVMPFTRQTSVSGVSDSSRPLLLQEGHSYFVSVKAVNKVGLTTLKSYGAFVVDASPPIAGHIFDGSLANAPSNHKDGDFQEDRTVIKAFWEGFHDPHSAILGYSCRAGTCPGCGDVVPEQHVGLNTDALIENLNLIPGLTYFVTVTACNAADLCISVTSDGVMVDDSPPVPGRVYDGGPGGGDINYQSSRLQLRAHWWGFHDPHSGLSHYEWRAGITPGAADILPSTRIELSEDALRFLPASDQLPVGTDIYITVRTYNRLGMWIEATSNGFRVDSSPPDVVDAPAVDETQGMAVRNTLVFCDLIRFSWKFSDPESGVKDQFISVSTHHSGDINIPPIKIAGSELDHTFTNLTLHEGSLYTITVVACNYAGLCTKAETEPVLVDGSPPSVGTFAVGTESAANLERHHIIWIDPTEPAKLSTTLDRNDFTTNAPPSPPRHHSGWMTWLEDTSTSTGSLALAWLGFADVHSGVSHYLVSVGRTYGGSELTPSGPFCVSHNNDGIPLDEGIVQGAVIPLEGSITGHSHPYLFISIWAVNRVGLPSKRHHSTFEASPTLPGEGALVLMRRCSPATCEGHCACAPIDRVCATSPGSCVDFSNSNPNHEIEVLDVLSLMSFNDTDPVNDIDDTATQHMMAAVWRVTEQKGLDVKWYEWSVGDDSNSSATEPAGVFDPARERIWFDVGQDNHAVITFDKDRKLFAGLRYHVFIRAWYDANTYAVFRSDGVTPDIRPPKISTVRGKKVKDLARSDSRKDTDYITEPSIVSISWEGVFLDSAMSHYQVSLSTYPGGEDVRQFADHTFPASVYSTQFSSLNLLRGQRYYSNVRAFNKAGLHTLRSSDGFVVDRRGPDPGLVFDGIDLHDLEYQNSSVVISASWHGFVDLESYIDHYEWCVGQTPGPADDDILPCTNVGINLSVTRALAVPLTEGVRYYSKISATDAAGLQSLTVTSDGFVVDVTPPLPEECVLLGDNLIQNPSFEGMQKFINPTEISLEDVSTDSVENMTHTSTTATSLFDAHSVTYETTAVSSTESVTVESNHSSDSYSYPTAPTILTTQTTLATGNVTDDAQLLSLQPWTVDLGSHFTLVAAGKKVAHDGDSFLSLHGSISQAFNTTPGDHYQLVVFASHAVPSHNPLLNQEGRIEAPGLNRIFRLYDRPAHGHSDQSLGSIRWQQHRFYFIASEDISTLKISSVGLSNGILLDDLQVRIVSTGPSSGDGSVEVHTQFIHSWSSMQAKWHFMDPESPIVVYSWAIGTTRGGTQLQSFTSVGTETDAINTDLRLAHGSYVYVTVMARNAADLVATAISDPKLIDLTPPTVHYVTDGGGAHDVDFTANGTSLTFHWSASDPESGIDRCEWALGSEPGLDDILPSSLSANATSSITTSLPQVMVEGQRLYVTVTCYNQAEQSSWKSSDGVTIVTEPPTSAAAVVKVKTLSETQYGTQDGYQSHRDSLKGSWDGFKDPFGIDYYECHLSGPSAFASWKPCGSASETHLDWSGLSLVDDATYSLSVRAVNHAGLSSEAVCGNFTVVSSKPAVGDLSLIRSSWLGDGMVVLAWDSLFSNSSSSLVYEVSLGTIPGGSDIMQWVETMETDIRVSPLALYTDYHLTLTAINAVGLSETVNKIINNA